MNNLKNKLKKNGGFTLIEMLIVVAIIAILIAVSIPLVGNALDRAKQATDAANERAAKAEMTIVYLNSAAGSTPGTGDVTYTKDEVYAYNAETGKLSPDNTPNAYGQYTGHTGKYIVVTYNETKHEVYMQWSDSIPNTAFAANGTDLCSTTLMKTTT